ncbi:hypothetical protein FPQ18DRAFT_336227 [Pyronema domesticum]|uniref:Similar to UPF0220 protein C8D2.02c acc. no. O43073 n=1 Tax=Pyronema omphalodes (strain CBS 100304) TaxID=1076935 RepID=U4LH40_PYROM|nr:hypothetical protein FPQ18DRAFT_336227 [Pyronema domesticum]CCX11342.1 Similar to UPF0220 protein C8D2.02c; acc. no. O43073 [Pyronema omphalodes CBS 100304]
MSHPFRIRLPALPSQAVLRSTGVYISGGLFATAFYTFLDASIFSRVANGSSNVHITILDWLPLICSILGMLIINFIDKTHLSNDDSFSYSGGSGVMLKAKIVLFMGFALMAGGLAGSLAVLVLKYLVPGHPWPTLWLGVAGAVANGLVMASSSVLWVSQMGEGEYRYDLSL